MWKYRRATPARLGSARYSGVARADADSLTCVHMLERIGPSGWTTRRGALGAVGIGLFSPAAAACAGPLGRGAATEGTQHAGGHGTSPGQLVAWPAQNRWPERFERAPADVQEAYRYAVANPQVLQYMPCFCGCYEEDRHTSNRDCYVEEMRPDGSVVLDPMSFG
jgi:hypothetical protein